MHKLVDDLDGNLWALHPNRPHSYFTSHNLHILPYLLCGMNLKAFAEKDERHFNRFLSFLSSV